MRVAEELSGRPLQWCDLVLACALSPCQSSRSVRVEGVQGHGDDAVAGVEGVSEDVPVGDPAHRDAVLLCVCGLLFEVGVDGAGLPACVREEDDIEAWDLAFARQQ
jgi:hypothetical protein